MRDNPEDANLPRRIGGRDGRALSASTATTAAATAADGELSGRIDGPARRDLSGSAAASAAASGAQVRRTRLICNGRRESAGRTL